MLGAAEATQLKAFDSLHHVKEAAVHAHIVCPPKLVLWVCVDTLAVVWSIGGAAGGWIMKGLGGDEAAAPLSVVSVSGGAVLVVARFIVARFYPFAHLTLRLEAQIHPLCLRQILHS